MSSECCMQTSCACHRQAPDVLESGCSLWFLCSPDCFGSSFVDQAGPKPRERPACDSQVLGLEARATTAWCNNDS